MAQFQKVRISNFMSISIGIVYLWFGALKFFSNLSPAEELAKNTIDQLTFGIIRPDVAIILLAIWETAIGLFLIFNIRNRMVLNLAIVHIICTFSPLLFFPDKVFGEDAFSLTLLGQYITKNLIIFAALMSLLFEAKEAKGFAKKKRFKIPPLFLSQRYFLDQSAKN